MTKHMKPKSIVCYVEDAMKAKFLFTIAEPDYAPKFRKHAAWWVRSGYKNNPTGPVKPFKVVIEDA